MKQIKRIVFIALMLLCIMTLLVSCTDKQEDANVKEYSTVFIDALMANEPEKAYSVVKNAISREDFTPVFETMRGYVSEKTEYELTQIGWSNSKSGSITTVTSTFEMKTPDRSYKVIASVKSNQEGLSGFQMLLINPEKTGTITSMKGASATQWIILVIAILEIAFVLWMFVDCIRHKLERKAFWLIFILLGMLAISFTWSAGTVNTGMGMGFILNMSMLAVYETGSVVLRIMIPIGAIIYAVMRKNLITPKQNENEPNISHSLHND